MTYKKIKIFLNTHGIYLLIFGFFLCICILVTIKHNNFYSYGFDLGIFDQVVWQYSQGHFPAASSIRNMDNILGDHFHPVLIVYGWLYKIWASPLLLLYTQNLAFVFGGLGLYKISQYYKFSSLFGLGIVLIYLLFEGNISALLFDFHPMVVAVSLLPWLIYWGFVFTSKRQTYKWFLYFVLFLFILLSKENMSLYLIFIGFFQLCFKKTRSLGAVSIMIAALYFYLVMNYFIPLSGGSNASYWSYDALGSGPADMIKNIFTQPLLFIEVLLSHTEKIISYTKHLGSGGIFMIFTPAILLIIPGYAQKFLSTRSEFWSMDQFHYSIDISFGLLIGAILFFAYMQRFKKYHSIIQITQYVFILIALVIHIYFSPLRNISYQSENKEIIQNYLEIIPKSASISTQNSIIPHLSQRAQIYLFPQVLGAEYILLEEFSKDGWPFVSREEFERIFLGIGDKQIIENINMPYIKTSISIQNKYNLIKSENNVYLFMKIK